MGKKVTFGKQWVGGKATLKSRIKQACLTAHQHKADTGT